MLNVAISGKRIRFATGVIVEPKHWNPDKQVPRSTDPHRNAHIKQLARVAEFVQRAYNELIPSGSSKSISLGDIDQLKISVRTFLEPEESEVVEGTSMENRFNQFIETYTIRTPNGMVTTHRPGEKTLFLYRRVLKDLLQWSRAVRKPLTFDSIDEWFYTSHCRWLQKERGLLDSSISNHIKVIKVFMKWSRSKGYHTTSAWESFWRDMRTGETIALTLSELRTIRSLDLSEKPRLARARDIFLLQVYTGMRYGDLSLLEPRHVDRASGIIRITTRKTNTKCIIPITAPLTELFKRYPSLLFEFPSGVKMNAYLKELGVLAGMSQSEIISHYSGGERTESTYTRAELLTTHVARATFVSVSIRFGLPEAVISKVTGHTAKGMLQKHYIILDDETVKGMVCKAWEQL